MEELKDYQERFINSKEKLVIGNFARGMGKTFCLAQKIIKEKPEKVLVYSKTHRVGINIVEKIKEIASDIFIANISYSSDNTKTIITWENNKKTTIFFENDEDVMWQYSANLTIFEDVYCLENYKALNEYIRKQDSFVQIICTTTENNYDKHLQKNFPNADIIEVDTLQGIREGLFDSEVLMKDFKKYDNHSFYNEFAILSNPDVNKSTQDKCIVANKIDIQGTLNINNNNDFLDRALNNLIKEYESVPVQNNTVMTRQNLLNMIMSIENTRNCGIAIGESFVSLAEKIQKSLYEKDKENLELLKDAKSKIEEKIKRTTDKPTRIMGLDYALMQGCKSDILSVCIVDNINKQSNNIIYIDEIELDNMNNSIEIIKSLCDKFNVDEICIQKCGSGYLLFNQLLLYNSLNSYKITGYELNLKNSNCLNDLQRTLNNLNCFEKLVNQFDNLDYELENGVIKYKTKDLELNMGLVFALKSIANRIYSKN